MAEKSGNEASGEDGWTGRGRWWRIAKYVISGGLIAYLAATVNWGDVLIAARGVSLPWLAVSLFYIPAGLHFIALRYCALVGGRVPLRAMLRLVVVQGAISTFLANVAGSLSYIGILVKVHKVPPDVAVQSTVVARLADMFTALIAAALLAALMWQQLEEIRSAMLVAILVSAGTLLSAAAAVLILRRLPPSVFAPRQSATAGDPPLWRRLIAFGAKVIRLDPGYVAATLPSTLLHSFALQAILAVSMYVNALAFGLEVSFLQAAFVGIVASFIASIPITVLGGLGVYEVSTVGLLALFGVPVAASAGMILVVRTIFFLVMAAALLVVRPPSA